MLNPNNPVNPWDTGFGRIVQDFMTLEFMEPDVFSYDNGPIAMLMPDVSFPGWLGFVKSQGCVG